MRLFFATDIHGSETCWRKFLNAARHYDADVLVLGGDMTGKALVPVVHDGSERWHGTLLEIHRELDGEEQVRAFEDAVVRRGYYPFRTDPEELARLSRDEERLEGLFLERMLTTVERWMALADERLAPLGVRCLVCPGNDDHPDVDAIVAAARHVELAEGRVVRAGEVEVASTGWANETPWATYREDPEPALKARLERIAAQVTAPPERTVFAFHCPPYGTGLDEAPRLDENLELVHAGRATSPVGSTAVREVIEAHGPALSLHGHIHESRAAARLGRTLAINPGSAYEQGQLLGALVHVDGRRSVKRYLLTSG